MIIFNEIHWYSYSVDNSFGINAYSSSQYLSAYVITVLQVNYYLLLE